MKSARLITTYQCEKNCAGCCNKNWKYEPPTPIKSVEELKGFDEVLVTGGEPLLFPGKLEYLLEDLVALDRPPRIIVYSTVPDYTALYKLLYLVDGVTITLHDNGDVERFNGNYGLLSGMCRVNVFYKDITVPVKFVNKVSYKHVEWIKDYPLPPNEKLFRLDPLWEETKK